MAQGARIGSLDQRSFTSALLFGVTAGLRSMTAPAALALAQQQPGARRIWLLGSRRAARILTRLAVAEMLFDKLPGAPNRTSPGSLMGRLLSGAMCGAAVSREDQRAGALLGAGGALAASFVGYSVRRSLARASGVPLLIALGEDALATGLGIAAAAMANDRGARLTATPSAHVA